jgi:hypothetical protein
MCEVDSVGGRPAVLKCRAGGFAESNQLGQFDLWHVLVCDRPAGGAQ